MCYFKKRYGSLNKQLLEIIPENSQLFIKEYEYHRFDQLNGSKSSNIIKDFCFKIKKIYDTLKNYLINLWKESKYKSE